MNVEQEARLRSEVELGRRAQQASDLYIEDFIKRLERELYESFISCTLDVAQLVHIKQLSMVIEDVKKRVLSDIDGGKVALKQLSEAIKH